MVKFDKKEPFNTNESYNVFSYMPEYALQEGEKTYKTVDTYVSFNELIEVYNRDKDSINSFADTESNIDFINPTIYDLLNLASDINSYKGLD